MKRVESYDFWVILFVVVSVFKIWHAFGEKAGHDLNSKPASVQASSTPPQSQRESPKSAITWKGFNPKAGSVQRSTTPTQQQPEKSKSFVSIAESDNLKSKIDFEPYSCFSEELFPSLLLTTASKAIKTVNNNANNGEAPRYGILEGTMGVIVRNVRKGESYTVEIGADKLIGKTTESFVMEEDAGLVVICPNINYDYVGLRRNTQTNFINISFRVTKESGNKISAVTRKWQVHQVNDYPIRLEHRTIMRNGSFNTSKLKQSSIIAGYVNENHPWIDTLLLEAKSTGICDQFIGYQGGNKGIPPQLEAIWKALQNRHLTYSSIVTTTDSPHHSLQHVRFLEQSISSTQANCLDGSVLLCSILRKIGLNVGIVLVPHHAYVCVLDVTGKKPLVGIETTLLGKTDLDQAAKAATEEIEFPLKKMAEDTTGSYDVVNISKLRKEGFLPIPFDEVAAIPSIPAQASSRIDPYLPPKEKARQERVLIANKLRRLVIEIQANSNQLNEEKYRVAAFNLFNEIRKHQSEFNGITEPPRLISTGIRDADEKMQARYAYITQILRTKSVPINANIDEDSLTAARTVVDALVELSNLPLDF